MRSRPSKKTEKKEPRVAGMTVTSQDTADEQLLARPGSFVASDTWRVLRVMGELVEGMDALSDVRRAVTLFGSARVRPGDPLYAQASETARLLGEAGFTVITGGGPGIMEAANHGARESGARSVGLNIELPFEQRLNPYVDVGVRFRYFFVRKLMLVKYSQAFVIFPGGFGTLDELFEAVVLIQTGKIRNFPLILVGKSYWSGLLDWLRQEVLRAGMIASADLNLVTVTDSPEEVRDLILAWEKGQRQQAQKEAAARAVTEDVLRADAPERRR